MTATHVDGVEVVADEPTTAPIKSFAGKPMVWTQTRTLLLADGRTVYGCQHCEYTSPNVLSIRPHLNKHRTVGPRPAAAAKDLSLTEVLERLATLDKVSKERDDWKARALTAERKLATLRNALGGGK